MYEILILIRDSFYWILSYITKCMKKMYEKKCMNINKGHSNNKKKPANKLL